MTTFRLSKRSLLSLLAPIALLLLPASSALAVAPAAHLTLRAYAAPTVFTAGANPACEGSVTEVERPLCDAIRVRVRNSGAASTAGSVLLKDTVPAGLTIKRVQMFENPPQGGKSGSEKEQQVGGCSEAGQLASCEYGGALLPDETLEMVVNVTVEPGAVSGLISEASVAGGGLPGASASFPDVVEQSLPFGANFFSAEATAPDGSADVQAGSHPYEFTTEFHLNSDMRRGPTKEEQPTSVEDVRDVVVDLPLGFLGGTVGVPQCPSSELESAAECPADTEVGHIVTGPGGPTSVNSPLYNLVPEHGVVAEFGFRDALASPHIIYASLVPTPSGYVVRATSPDVGQINLDNVLATFYGTPAAHNGGGSAPVAMFTNPASCTGQPLSTGLYMDSWQHPGALAADETPVIEGAGWTHSGSESPPVTGCDRLSFDPEAFAVAPETAASDSATGLSFDLRVPQSEAPGSLATPPLRDATVTLPAGVIINPAAAGGLMTCSEAQIGWLGTNGPKGEALANRGLTNFSPEHPACPDASKVGSVEITTPLTATTLTGTVYLAAQNENPYHSLLGGYIVVDDPTTGVIVKIPGKLTTDPATGQITGTFEENPQLPFSDLKLRFFGGTRGELATPEGCGTFTTTSDLEPWSAPDSGPDATPSSSFQINSGCTPGFGPAFTAGTTNPQAGAYSPFVLSFSRQDSEQGLSGLSVTLPPGLVGKLAGISQCSDAQLAAAANNPSGASEQANPSCPANSRVGSVQSAAGVGSQPFSLGGSAYLTGPYKGAPYGIAVVVPAVAGPFDLGNVVVRSKLEIDPNDAHVTVTSDNFPTIIDAKGSDNNTDGFPIRLRSISITMDRPQFTLNPTSCTPMRINGALSSTAGATVPVGSQFQVASCASLKFAPKFSASTLGQASKAGGTSLDVKVGYPTGPLGTYANIRSVKVDLPKQLPSRLTTLQRACVAATFEANPANCPAESDVGMATAGTPLLANPLVGPAYIVSHGGEAFPDLEIVLQGEGIKLILDGNTKIKDGITSSTFKAIPDAPVSSFDLQLHSGKFSILGANVPQSAHYSLCGQTLNMPTVITAQNGAVIKQTTKIGVSGCKKVKKKAKHHKKSGRRSKKEVK